MQLLEFMPVVEAGHARVIRIGVKVLLPGAREAVFKTQEFEVEAGENFFDLRQREAMLLDVKQQVAAQGQIEEIATLRHWSRRVIGGQ